MEDQKQPATSSSQLREKWGSALDEGFLVIPVALLRHQHELEIADGELVVLLNLLMSWWKPSDFPFPRATTIAKRMGVSVRTVQRHLDRLVEKGLIRRFWGADLRSEHGPVTQFDMSGVVERLKRLDIHPAPPPRKSLHRVEFDFA